jgi:hypothetical protein
MTVTQWRNVCERVKVQKTRPWFIKGEPKRWCNMNRVELKSGFRDALDQGSYSFDCLVIQCIGFDQRLYEKLARSEGRSGKMQNGK